MPLVAVGQVRVDLVSIDNAKGKTEPLRSAVLNPPLSGQVPVVALAALVYRKLKANRQKDLANLVELLKRGRVVAPEIDRYLEKHAPEQVPNWERTKKLAAEEE